MCGIVGLIELETRGIDPKMLNQMSNSISHRGNDAGNQVIIDNVGLAHRRLAIIDLKPESNQPMRSSNGRYIVNFNGEIYNFKEIKLALQKMGTSFVTNSDTEVLLESFAQWGIEAIPRLNGMFAVILYDVWEKKLFIARDRFGIKPLYMALSEKRIMFSSEQKAIKNHPQFETDFNFDALQEYLTFQNIISTQTFEKKIEIFKPGHSMEIESVSGRILNYSSYWDYNFDNSLQGYEENEILEELDNLIENSVQLQSCADVRVGSYLSSGIDSSLISMIATRKKENLATFTIGFQMNSVSNQEMNYDESFRAAAYAKTLKSDHYEMLLGPEALENCLETIVYHLEEPRVGQSYPNFYAAKLASSKVKVVLSGTGGDELFGGYPWRYFVSQNDSKENFLDQYFRYWQRLLKEEELQNLIHPIRNKMSNGNVKEIFTSVFRNQQINQSLSDAERIKLSLYFEAKTFLSGLLMVEDKLHMANGIENRTPFLDNKLVDFATRIPSSMLVSQSDLKGKLDENDLKAKKNQIYGNKSGKIILRKLSARKLANSTPELNKQGFAAPDMNWFRNENRKYISNRLFDKKAPIYDVLAFDTSKQLIEEHLNGTSNRRLLVWSLLYLDEYFKQNV